MQPVVYWGEARPVSEALGGAVASVRTAWSFDGETRAWRVWQRTDPDATDSLMKLMPGQAYFVEAVREVRWWFHWAGPTFSDVSEAAGIAYTQHAHRPVGECLFRAGRFCETERMSGGAAAADIDGDGWVDLIATRLDAPDMLFHNRGDGTFEDVTVASGLGDYALASNGAGWADIDNDGDPDLLVTTLADTRNYLFINDGTGRFTEEALGRGTALESSIAHAGFSVAFGDYDRDGWVDIHATEWGSRLAGATAPSHARLLRNRGAVAPGYFEDVTDHAGVLIDEVASQTGSIGQVGAHAFASAFVDLDNDGWQDLVVVADFGRTRLFWNDGDGTFTDGTVAARVGSDQNGMGLTFGDYDADGDLDWFVTSIFDPNDTCASRPCHWGASGNRLYAYADGRQFIDATDAAGVRDGRGAGAPRSSTMTTMPIWTW